MTEDLLWNDAMAMQARRDEAFEKLRELVDWAGWDISRGDTCLIYTRLHREIRVSTEEEVEVLMESMQSRIDMMMLKKLKQGL